jgi:hypothetical protein
MENIKQQFSDLVRDWTIIAVTTLFLFSSNPANALTVKPLVKTEAQLKQEVLDQFSNANLTIPANSLTAGKIIDIDIFGTIGSTASSPTIGFKVMLGTSVLTNNTTGALATLTSNQWYFSVPLRIQIQSIGATGKAIAVGAWSGPGISSIMLGANTTPTATSQVTIDTTGSLKVDMQATWSAASATNTIQVLGGTVRISG